MAKTKILIVEDERIIAEDINNSLESLGYVITSIVSTGEEAIKKVEEETPDLVLMDIVLKGEINGINTAQDIFFRLGIPVVYLTAYTDKTTVKRAKITEPFGYIVKPYTNRELYSTIEIALYKNQVQRRLEHLNNVLRAMRKINQMIVKEKNRDKLIQGACDNLTLTGSFPQAWIGIMDDRGRLVATAESGLGKNFAAVKAMFKHGQIPDLYQKALSQQDITFIEDASAIHTKPSLIELYQKKGAMISRLEYSDKIYGLLFISVPSHLFNSKNEISIFETVAGDISFALYSIEIEEKRILAEKKLKESHKQSAKMNILLQEKNIALREVMGQLKEERERIEAKIQTNVDRLLLPVIHKLKTKSTLFDKSYLNILEDNLANLISSFGIHLSHKMYTLTPREIAICNMIKSGLSSKEISTLLHISQRTVDTHRNRIRKKLGITKKAINLASFLQSL